MKGLKKLLSIGVVVAMLFVLAPMLVPSVALAGDVSGNVTLTLGTPTMALNSSYITFNETELAGDNITLSNEQPSTYWLLTDESGDGSGWSVQVKLASSTFENQTTHDAGDSDNLTFDSSLAHDKCTMAMLVDPTVSATIVDDEGTSGPVDELKGTGGVVNEGTAAYLTINDQILVSAIQDTGMGTYQIQPYFTLQFPAAAYYGTYQVTLNITTAFDSPT